MTTLASILKSYLTENGGILNQAQRDLKYLRNHVATATQVIKDTEVRLREVKAQMKEVNRNGGGAEASRLFLVYQFYLKMLQEMVGEREMGRLQIVECVGYIKQQTPLVQAADREWEKAKADESSASSQS